MPPPRRAPAIAPRLTLWSLGWLLGVFAGALWLGLTGYQEQRAAFETDARIAHRLLSQQVVQHEAVLATIGLLQPATTAGLAAVYPQIQGVRRRAPGAGWGPTAGDLPDAEAVSARTGRPALALLDFVAGRYAVVLAPPASQSAGSAYALEIALAGVVPWAEWPLGRHPEEGATRLWLEHANQVWVVNPGSSPGPWGHYSFRKHLAAESQPFDVVAERDFSLVDLPWLTLGLWALGWAGLLAIAAAWRRQQQARQRAEELLRLGQVARLNALGELAAGLAHEINQPLTAVLASTQAASRLLAEEPPDADAARPAMAQAVQQARRAADVVARLRRAVERPNTAERRTPIDLAALARGVLQLLAPECQRRGVVARVLPATEPVIVRGDPVAVEQIVHNLVSNALQALEHAPTPAPLLEISLAHDGRHGVLRVRDNGPGISPDLAPRIFEPFVSTREGGLGLGLSLCQTLAQEMGGNLQLEAAAPGAVFRLDLPVARAEDRP